MLQHESEQQAKSEDVGSLIQLRLGSTKSGCAGDRLDPPIHHVNLAELADHHVLRLEVSVNHASRVGKGERLAHPADDAKPLGEEGRSLEVTVQRFA